MKNIIALATLLAVSTATMAEPTRVTVNGTDWDVDVIKGTYAEHATTLTAQPWFGHKTLAKKFLIEFMGFDPTIPTYGADGYRNHGGNRSTYFTFYDVVSGKGNLISGSYFAANVPGGGCVLSGHSDRRNPERCALSAIETQKKYCDGSAGVCYFAVATLANPSFDVMPASGRYSQRDSFDVVVTGVTASIDHVTSIYDGNDISHLLNPCWKKSGTSIICNGAKWSDQNIGQHTFEIYLDLSNGEQHYKSVTWDVY